MGYWLGLLGLIYFATVGIIDLEHRYIMMIVILAGAALGLGLGTHLHGLTSTLLGGLGGLLRLLLLLAALALGDVGAEEVEDLLAHGLELDAQVREHLRGLAVALPDEPEQDVLGPDVVVVQQARLFLGEDHDPASSVGEALEHL